MAPIFQIGGVRVPQIYAPGPPLVQYNGIVYVAVVLVHHCITVNPRISTVLVHYCIMVNPRISAVLVHYCITVNPRISYPQYWYTIVSWF